MAFSCFHKTVDKALEFSLVCEVGAKLENPPDILGKVDLGLIP